MHPVDAIVLGRKAFPGLPGFAEMILPNNAMADWSGAFPSHDVGQRRFPGHHSMRPGHDILFNVGLPNPIHVDHKVLNKNLPRWREVFPPSRLRMIDARNLRRRMQGLIGMQLAYGGTDINSTLISVLTSLSGHAGRTEGPSLDIIRILEEAFARDIQHHHGASVQSTSIYFSCLTEIANVFLSRPIARALHNFAMRNIRDMLQADLMYLFHILFYIIHNSLSTITDITLVLREVLENRPTIFAELLDPSSDYYQRHPFFHPVYSTLMQLRQRLDDGGIGMPPAGRFPRLNLQRGRRAPRRLPRVTHPSSWERQMMDPWALMRMQRDRDFQLEQAAEIGGDHVRRHMHFLIEKAGRTPGWSDGDFESDVESYFDMDFMGNNGFLSPGHLLM
ncbi:hypothetical protein BT63DRAFT_425959 [Microthyrium microscopicum]|uniref:Uncharacterized protein n=1 Tax=Microthyrium microscopicum TaxID=703497 RepID=A0A6A6UCM1_9PEZI|nr:hypothetical protein BT63DRAFT_425959 [Microthyrium microscopicum]